ncbi:MAG: alanine racemase [Silvanigrellaceae bacterium]|nr:alanine racemase [Silvanigrellaceae bacterium]
MNVKKIPYPQVASWVEIDRNALAHNIETFKKIISHQSKMGAVLKSNAYGHGMIEVFKEIHGKVDVIYLIHYQDAFLLRKFEQENDLRATRIMVIGALNPQEVIECVKQNIEIVIYSETFQTCLDALRKENLPTKAMSHIHIDTGLGREGFYFKGIQESIAFLKNSTDVLHIQGVMSHFSNTEDVTEQSYALSQIEAFELSLEIILKELELPNTLEKHFAASAATLAIPKSRFDIVRIGISLYGLWPSSETRLSAKLILPELPKLKPAMSWRCKSQQIKWLPQDRFVGYGCTYQTLKSTFIALLPVGYFDGYSRLVSNRAYVLINGHRCAVLGRVMMNHIIVDITDAEVLQGETEVTATLLGTDGKETISADQLGGWSQTINYEVVTRVGPHLQRIITH